MVNELPLCYLLKALYGHMTHLPTRSHTAHTAVPSTGSNLGFSVLLGDTSARGPCSRDRTTYPLVRGQPALPAGPQRSN